MRALARLEGGALLLQPPLHLLRVHRSNTKHFCCVTLEASQQRSWACLRGREDGVASQALTRRTQSTKTKGPGDAGPLASRENRWRQWNCSSSVEPVSALTLELPPWITVVTSSK